MLAYELARRLLARRLLVRRLILPFLLLNAAAAATASAGDVPRVSRSVLIATEKTMDGRLAQSAADNPFFLLGATRGIYLDGYGAVFTAEVNLVAVPPALQMFRPTFSPQEVAQHKQKKLARIPDLERNMRQAMVETAASLDMIPADQQIVLVAMLSKYAWEDLKGVPLQIMMQAPRGKLLEMRGNEAGLASVIRVTEN